MSMDKFLVKRPQQKALPKERDEAAAVCDFTASSANATSPLTSILATGAPVSPKVNRKIKEDKKQEKLPASFSRWKTSYTWLSLNSTGKAICSVCTEANEKKFPLPTDGNCMISLQAFVKTGFHCWKNAVERFKAHESSELHRSATQAIASSKKTSVVQHLSSKKNHEMIDARTALGKIFSTINLLARQGLALRGSGNDESSNLIQFLKTRAEDVSELDSWLKRSRFTWLHHDVVNEILERMADKILRKKLDEIKSAVSFSLIMDETSDLSRFEQVSICIRIVLENLTIREIFIGFYKTDDTKSETLFKIVEDVFVRNGLSFNDLRGQCYDGTSNMSGKITGLQSRIREKEPRALYVHCSAHTLNLVVQDALEDVACARNFIGLVKDIINFIRDSPKRLAQFKNLQSAAGSNSNLTPYCPTRWCMRVKSLVTLRTNENYLAALEFFESRKSDREIDSSASAKAAGFLKCMESFEFFLLLNVTIDIFERIEVLNAELQKHDLCMNESHEKVKTVINSLRVMRDSRFEPVWHQVIISANELGVEKPELQRPCKRTRRYESSNSAAAAHTFRDLKDYYRKVYYEIVDTVLSSLTDRFQSDTMSFLTTCENFVTGKEVDLETITHFYNQESEIADCILDSTRLKLHRDMFLDILRDRKIQVRSLKDVVHFLKENTCIPGLVCEYVKLIKLILVIPGSSCTCERSFSALRRLKNYLRSTMLQNRLNSIALLHVHKEDAEALDLEELMDEFINKNKTRKSTFAV